MKQLLDATYETFILDALDASDLLKQLPLSGSLMRGNSDNLNVKALHHRQIFPWVIASSTNEATQASQYRWNFPHVYIWTVGRFSELFSRCAAHQSLSAVQSQPNYHTYQSLGKDQGAAVNHDINPWLTILYLTGAWNKILSTRQLMP